MQQGQPDSKALRPVDRRRFLAAIGALGVAGLAGCGGDGGDTDTPTPEPSGTDSTETNTPDPTDTDPVDTDTPTPEGPGTPEPTQTPTATATDTQTPTGKIPEEDPASLLSFDSDAQAAPGSTTTISGTIKNPYLFVVSNGEVTVSSPGSDWEISATEGTTFSSLERLESQTASWEVTVPDSASGTYDLTFTVSYAGPRGNQADVEVTQPLLVRTPGEAPFGIDCGGIQTGETVTIDGLQFLPDPETSQNANLGGGNVVIPESAWWWNDVQNFSVETAGAAVEDAPNAAVFQGDVSDTEFDPMYYTEHWLEEGELRYVFNIANGTYDVTLHFAEIAFEASGQRVFTVNINGEAVLEELDIYAEVGAYTAMTRTFEVEVTNNELLISATASANNPKFSGIEVREV